MNPFQRNIKAPADPYAPHPDLATSGGVLGVPLIRMHFAAEGQEGGGSGNSKERRRNARQLLAATEIASAYRALDIPAAAIVATIPEALFRDPIQQRGTIPSELKNAERWITLPRAYDDQRPYYHIYLTARSGDWNYNLRWHTPTPKSVWAEKSPTCTLERRWAHFVEQPNYRPHEVLLQGLEGASDSTRLALQYFMAERGYEFGKHLVIEGGHGWIAYKAHRDVCSLRPPVAEWAREIRDSAHWDGHPAGYERPNSSDQKSD